MMWITLQERMKGKVFLKFRLELQKYPFQNCIITSTVQKVVYQSKNEGKMQPQRLTLKKLEKKGLVPLKLQELPLLTMLFAQAASSQSQLFLNQKK